MIDPNRFTRKRAVFDGPTGQGDMTMADLTDREFEILKKCWRHSPNQGWEPRGGTNTPNIRKFVEAGYLRVVDGICGFERLKNVMVTWTAPARRLMPLIVGPGPDAEQIDGLEAALADLSRAVDFMDRVRSSGAEERVAAGDDHWEWLESAARKVAAFRKPASPDPVKSDPGNSNSGRPDPTATQQSGTESAGAPDGP